MQPYIRLLLLVCLVSLLHGCSDSGVNGTPEIEPDHELSTEGESESIYCDPGEKSCSLDDVIICDEDGLEWLFVASCYPGECQDGRCTDDSEEELSDGDLDDMDADDFEPDIEDSEGWDSSDLSEDLTEDSELDFSAEEDLFDDVFDEEEESVFCSDQFEGQNSDETGAVLLTAPVSLEDLWLCPYDEDWFAVDLQQGEGLKVSVRFSHEDGDIDMKLYAPDHNGLSDWLQASLTMNNNEDVIVENVPEGRYYIRLQSYQNANTYSLQLEVSPWALFSGNDTCQEPAKIIRGQTVSNNTLQKHDVYHSSCSASLGPDAVWSFQTFITRNIVVRLQSDFDAVVYVRGECDNEADEQGCSDSVSTGEEAITLTDLAAGTYYIFVDGVHPDDMGDYTLSLE